MSNLITIDQLLESVDLDFEPRWVTKDGEGGAVMIWKRKPTPREEYGAWVLEDSYAYEFVVLNRLKLAEFDGKDWQECIYEVPRKVDPTKWIGKLCRFWSYGFVEYYAKLEQVSTKRSDKPFFAVGGTYWYEHCEPVRPDDDVIYKDAVNEYKGRAENVQPDTKSRQKDVLMPKIGFYTCSDGAVFANEDMAKSHEANLKSKPSMN